MKKCSPGTERLSYYSCLHSYLMVILSLKITLIQLHTELLSTALGHALSWVSRGQGCLRPHSCPFCGWQEWAERLCMKGSTSMAIPQTERNKFLSVWMEVMNGKENCGLWGLPLFLHPGRSYFIWISWKWYKSSHTPYNGSPSFGKPLTFRYFCNVQLKVWRSYYIWQTRTWTRGFEWQSFGGGHYAGRSPLWTCPPEGWRPRGNGNRAAEKALKKGRG